MTKILHNLTSICKIILVAISLIFYSLSTGYAMDVTLAWDANTEQDLAGYILYYKTDPNGSYVDQNKIEDPNATTYTVHNLNNTKTYFVLTAYDTSGLESDYSNEVSTDANCTTYYKDADDDGYGIDEDTKCLYAPEGAYTAIQGDDCDDSVASCNTDCTGLKYPDSDGDDYGDPDVSHRTCDAPAGYILDNTDCLDSDPNTYPGATEQSDGIDNDCDGSIPDNEADADSDGFKICDGDCDDTNPNSYPGASENCDCLDNDCDEIIDNNCTLYITTHPTYMVQLGQMYEYKVKANRNDAVYELLKGPPGLELNNTGQGSALINWTPSTKGNYKVSIRVSRCNNLSVDTQSWKILVKKPSKLLGFLTYLDDQTNTLISLTCGCDDDNVLPIKIDLYNKLKGDLAASTKQNVSQDILFIDTNCSTGQYYIESLSDGPYTLIAYDYDPYDNTCYEDTNHYGIFESETIHLHLSEGLNWQNIRMKKMHRIRHRIHGTVGKDPNGPEKIDLILHGTNENDLSVKKRATLNDGDHYNFSVLTGVYTLFVQAKGYKGKTENMTVNNDLEQNFTLKKKDKPSVSIIREDVIDNFSLKLHYRHNNPDGEAQGWTDANASLSVKLFNKDDGNNTNGIPDDPNNPHGVVVDTTLSNGEIFEVEYLTSKISLGNLEGGDPNNIMTVLEDSYIVGLKGEINVGSSIYPFVRTFKVLKPAEDQDQFISGTKETFKPIETSTKTYIPISTWITINQVKIPLTTGFNAGNLDPSLLFQVDEQGNKAANINPHQEIELSIEYKTMTDDANTKMVNITFKDSEGNPVEYNPLDPITGERNPEASPIIIEIPLRNDLQDVFNDPNVTLADIEALVATDVPDDFIQINGVWQPIPGLCGIYFKTGSGAINIFKPEASKGENIKIIASVLKARITTTHNSSGWYCSTFQESGCTAIVDSLPDVKGECNARVTPLTATDTCGKLITATTTNPTYYSSQGIYTITWIYNDYFHTMQTQKVIVSDTKPPIPDADPLPDIFAEGKITLKPPKARDNCSGSIKATTSDPTTYFNPGTYTLTWSYDDGHGNCTKQKQTLIIVDIPPTIICPPDIIIERCNTEVIAVELGEPTIFDISDPDPLIVNDAPEFFPIGTTFVTWTATDFSNNQSSCTQTVTIGPPYPPGIDFSGTPTSGNAPLNVFFTATNSGGPFTTLYWDFGDGESSTEQNPQHTYRLMGTYTVSLNAIGPGGEGGKVKSNYIIVKAADGPDLTGSWIYPGLFNLPSNIHRGLSRKTVSVKNMRQLMLRGWGPFKKRIKFQVKNIGNVKASNRFKIAFYLSMDGTTCEQLLKKKSIYTRLNAGQNKTFSCWFIRNYDQSRKYIIAVIDPDDQVVEANETNNKMTLQL